MECQNYREQFPLLLTNSLDHRQLLEIESHLAGCADCREEFATAKKLWDLMGEVSTPEPSDSMQMGFNTMLSDFKEEVRGNKNPFEELITRIREYWTYQAQPRLAVSFLLVSIGLLIGYILHQPGQSAISYNKQIDSLSSQVSEIKQVMMLSLLQDPSASQRIRAVSYTEEMSNVNIKVIDALFTTLNEDPNVNVRLATLDALVKLAGEPTVREGLVRSIDLQDSPVMQSAIADVMVQLQEKSSVKSLQKLLERKGLNQMVKINIEKNIHKLI